MNILLPCCDKLYHPSGKDPRFGPEHRGSISAVITECAIAHITTERPEWTVFVAEKPEKDLEQASSLLRWADEIATSPVVFIAETAPKESTLR